MLLLGAFVLHQSWTSSYPRRLVGSGNGLGLSLQSELDVAVCRFIGLERKVFRDPIKPRHRDADFGIVTEHPVDWAP